jgi:thiamine biosynthesis protein ThiS
MTVADLLQELEIRSDRVAIEVNLNIVDKQEYDTRTLSEGDKIEIMSFIGGGDRSPLSLEYTFGTE